jgi:mRNA-degrading endonuclease RelE of RelBE toxin-antitoxin system
LAWTIEYLSTDRKQLKKLDPKVSDRIVRLWASALPNQVIHMRWGVL